MTIKNDLIKIKVINPRALGKLSGIEVFLTKELQQHLVKQKTRDGNLLDLFKKGRALRGFKHLLEVINNNDKKAKIIFTKCDNKKIKSDFYINFDDYRKVTQGKFYAFYRETGIDSAGYFLNSKFPNDFKYDRGKVSEIQLRKVDRNFTQVLQNLSKKAKNKKILLQQTTEVVKSLKGQKKLLKSEIEKLEELQKSSNIALFQSRIRELEERLESSKQYSETRGKNSWQAWIYKNNWLWGSNYQTPIEKEKIGFDSIPDYLFPTIDGFLDILEIKLPSHDAILKDKSHAHSFKWSSKVNEAIGQVVTYLHEIEIHQFEIQQRIGENYKDLFGEQKIFAIKPRAFILIGRNSSWNSEQKRALRKLNYSLHGIEVLTYDDLVNRGNKIIEMYRAKPNR
ncbi:DUF4263 domain-containing protein [candidate division WOR-3 bacterium]|nr:DUF4263 domain-containing protein [candidate division WOR-3 bacterium]